MTVADALATPFRHEALLYADDDAYMSETVPFVRAGLAAGEPILVAVAGARIRALRAALGDAAASVRFEDMSRLGTNPARIIPAWEAFVRAHPGRPLRGIGEPIWPGRSGAELTECHRHESLLNVAFADTPAFTLLCPYDATRLAPATLARMRRTHPRVRTGGVSRPSARFEGLGEAASPCAEPLPPPSGPVVARPFDGGGLRELRALVRDELADVDAARAVDFTAAVNEIAANSVRHGGGMGEARLWREAGAVLCEISDRGRIADPLAGRRRPVSGQVGGYGLWLANQLCDLVQLRTAGGGTTIRLHLRLG